MTVLSGQGDGIVGERIIAYGRKIELMKIPIPRTHKHRAQAAKLNDAECYVVKPIRWKSGER
jgi:hypothetical protein